MAEWLVSSYFSTLVQQPVQRALFVRVGMDKHELVALVYYLNMLIRDDTTISNDDIVVGIAPNIDDLFRQRIRLPATKNIATHFERRDAYRTRGRDLCFIWPSS